MLIILNIIDTVSLTCDILTSNSNFSYLGVTAHYVNKKYQFINHVLTIHYLENSHTGPYLFDFISYILKQWGLEKKNGIVSDCGSDIKRALDSFPNKVRTPCAAHSLDHCAKDLLIIRNIKIKYEPNGNTSYRMKLCI